MVGRKVSIWLFLILVSLGVVYAVECGSVPTNGCVVTQDTTFVPGTYYLPKGISVGEAALNCNGAILKGDHSSGYSGINIWGGVMTAIKNCVIEGYRDGIEISWDSYNVRVYNNKILNNTRSGISFLPMWTSASYNNISNNHISNNSEGILFVSYAFPDGGCGLIFNNQINNNVIEKNNIGIMFDGYCGRGWIHDNIINQNIIRYNNKGVYVGSDPAAIINRNDMYGNGYNIYAGIYGILPAENNWWGSANEAEISAKIYDCQDNSDISGCVDYTPWLTSPLNPQVCFDGTPFGQCSSTKPLYCDSGNLVNKCQVCGCNGDYICQNNGSCSEPLLPDLFVSSMGINYNPQNPVEDDDVTISILFYNLGEKEAIQPLIEVSTYSLCGLSLEDCLQSRTVKRAKNTILPGEAEIEEFGWKAMPGTYLIKVVLDPNNEITEEDENNNDATSSIFVASYKYKVLFIPLGWNSLQEKFDEKANIGINKFILDTNLASCPQRVKIDIMDVKSEDFDTFVCCNNSGFCCDIKNNCCQNLIYPMFNPFCSGTSLGEIKNFAEKHNYKDYDAYIGLTENMVCPLGQTNGQNIIVRVNSRNYTIAHELGHTFDLEDEYCSNQAGSTDKRCNDGDIQQDGSLTGDINYLDADMPSDCPPDGSNASYGFGCCNNGRLNGNCDKVDYGACCIGNKNSKGGISTMSFDDADVFAADRPEFFAIERGFDDHSRAHLNKQPKLNCGEVQLLAAGNATNETTEPVLDINFIFYKNGSIKNKGIFRTFGRESYYPLKGHDYTILILDNLSNAVWNKSFDIYFDYNGPVRSYEDYSNITYGTFSFNYKISYNSSIYELRVKNKSSVIFSKILDFCNENNICDLGETYWTCQKDCGIQSDGVCDPYKDYICDTDCVMGVDPDCSWNISLAKGWNLLSIPLISANNTAGFVFQSLNYSDIYTHENNSYIELNNNSKIDTTKAYWINSNENQTLYIEGQTYFNTINLTKGWRFVGYPSLLESFTIADCIKKIFAYDSRWVSFKYNKQYELNTLKSLKPGFGYWVEVNCTTEWPVK